MVRKKEQEPEYSELSTVISHRNDLTAEEFPEGPYGSSLINESLGKEEWHEGQRSAGAFSFENIQLHEGIDRDYAPDEDIPDIDT